MGSPHGSMERTWRFLVGRAFGASLGKWSRWKFTAPDQFLTLQTVLLSIAGETKKEKAAMRYAINNGAQITRDLDRPGRVKSGEFHNKALFHAKAFIRYDESGQLIEEGKRMLEWVDAVVTRLGCTRDTLLRDTPVLQVTLLLDSRKDAKLFDVDEIINYRSTTQPRRRTASLKRSAPVEENIEESAPVHRTMRPRAARPGSFGNQTDPLSTARVDDPTSQASEILPLSISDPLVQIDLGPSNPKGTVSAITADPNDDTSIRTFHCYQPCYVVDMNSLPSDCEPKGTPILSVSSSEVRTSESLKFYLSDVDLERVSSPASSVRTANIALGSSSAIPRRLTRLSSTPYLKSESITSLEIDPS